MVKHRVVLVRAESGDWEAMYVDGQRKYEGHHMPIDDALYTVAKLGGFTFECVYDGDNTEGFLLNEEDIGFPEILTDETLDRLR